MFVQNLVSRMAVPDFPDEAAGTGKDEEHPCINGGGTLIAVEKPNPVQKDIVLVSRSGSTFTAVPTPNLNDKEHDDRFCQLSPGGGYISDIQNNEYKLYERLVERLRDASEPAVRLPLHAHQPLLATCRAPLQLVPEAPRARPRPARRGPYR